MTNTTEARRSSQIFAARQEMTQARQEFGMHSEQAISAEREVMRLEALGYQNLAVPLFFD